jgi:Galactoside-binding lectin
MAPSESKRFSINIAAQDNNLFDNILFHFNPRQRERGGQLVVNDKRDTIWGQAIQLPLSQVPLMFGQTACTLMIQINGEGFDIFIEGQHCARLEHRKELPVGNTNLIMQFPSTDDYGAPENWTVYKVREHLMGRLCCIFCTLTPANGIMSGVVGAQTNHGQRGCFRDPWRQ